MLRPETKKEETFFTKLVELDRLRIATRKMEDEEWARNKGKDPDISVRRACMSLGGVTVKTILV